MTGTITSKTFKPSKNHIKFLRAWANYPPKDGITNLQLAMATGVSERAMYRWFRNRQFLEWFEKKTYELVRGDLSKVWRSVHLAAMRQDMTAAKLYAERFDPGYKPTTRQEQHITLPALDEEEQQLTTDAAVSAVKERFRLALSEDGEN